MGNAPAPPPLPPLASDRKVSSLFVEAVAGSGEPGGFAPVDGELKACRFRPSDLCRYGDSLFIAEARTVRQLDGVLGVTDPGNAAAEFEARAMPLLMAVISGLPKELARLMTQYAPALPAGVRTLAGQHMIFGLKDGVGLKAQFVHLSAIVADGTDPVGGPALLIADRHRVRRLHVASCMVTTIAGQNDFDAHVDGPALQTARLVPDSMAIAPNGVLFVGEVQRAVRRISAAPTTSGEAARGERMVTTLIGQGGPSVQFCEASAPSLTDRTAGDGAVHTSAVHRHSARCRVPVRWL
jgi:hypothetical protein